MAADRAALADPTTQQSRKALMDLWTSDWHKSAPKDVVRAYERGETAAGWAAWTSYLCDRKNPRDVAELGPEKPSPLLWSLPAETDIGDAVTLCEQVGKPSHKNSKALADVAEQLPSWLAEAAGRGPTVAYAVECLAWCRGLPQLAGHLSETLWWELLHHLIATAREAAALDVDQQPLEYNLLAGELPLTLGYEFSELKTCRDLRQTARAALSRAVVDLVDGEGMPHATNLPLLRPLLACWTRCRMLGEELDDDCWDDAADEQYQWLVTQSLRLMRADGSQVLCSDDQGDWCRPLFDTAVDLGGDDADEEIADHVLPGRKADYEPEEDWPSSAYESEWSELAVLQNKWSKKARRLTVNYANQHTQIELTCGSDLLLAGTWTLDLAVGGRTQTIDSGDDWEQVAWESDEDVDYLELELEITPELRVQRSCLLARRDQFLLIADAVMADHPMEINYTSRLPLAPGIQAVAAGETRELTLTAHKQLARILPLALPEWQNDARHGTLDVQQDGIMLQQTGNQSLFAPLFLDLSQRRTRKRLTWRQLSVAEERRNVPPDVAVGYRIEVGDEQWLIYRSLKPATNRTVLGQNLICEMHVSRFLQSGDVEELLELES